MPSPSMGPERFWTVQIILAEYQQFLLNPILFWSGQNHFGQVQTIQFSPENANLNLTKMIWTQPKRIGPIQNDWYSAKMIWTVQNDFGPIEGQGIKA